VLKPGRLFRGHDQASERLHTLLAASVIAILLAALSWTPQWQVLQARLFDFASLIAPPAPAEPGAVIVAVDEPSFAEIGLQWPWPRSLHSELIEALRAAGTKVIALDIVFAEPSDPAADRTLAEAMGPDVVLAADETLLEFDQAAQLARVEPMPALLQRGAASGLTSVTLDGDGALRRMPAHPDGFARTVLEKSAGPAAGSPLGALIQWFGPPRSYPTVSYYQALEPQKFLPPGFFQGKTVIVGLSLQNAPLAETGGADAYPTAYTLATGRLTAGAEAHATILDNLRHGLFVRPTGQGVQVALIAAAALLGWWAARHGTSWRAAAWAVAAVIGALLASWVILRFGRLWLPPVLPAAAFAVTLAYQATRDFAHERRVRREISRAFSQYVSPAVVDRLARDPTALKLGGERRTLTILFCDVRGFTTISESLKDDPERLTALMNRLLNPLSDAILAENGTIDKYIGDCIMAFWNAPLDDPDHARHAASAALRMLDAVDGLNTELAAETAADGGHALQLAVGIGINTGECVVGNMGSDRRFDYSALGDAVNLASRLEGASKDLGVPLVLAAATAAAIGGAFPTVPLGAVSVKGRHEPVSVFTLGRPAAA
jgi:adenylate cyclase